MRLIASLVYTAMRGIIFTFVMPMHSLIQTLTWGD
jgi:hypothetical protein